MSVDRDESQAAESIRAWLVGRSAELLRCPPEAVDVDASFDRLGFDSATAVGVTLDLEDLLGRPVEPSVFYDHNTIRRLADHLAEGGGPASPVGSVPP